MMDGGVPVIPGLSRCEPDMTVLREAAEKIGYPILVKATAGGGGKGIRIVRSPGEMEEAVAQASSEAFNAFGNREVYIEKGILNSRFLRISTDIPSTSMNGNVPSSGGIRKSSRKPLLWP